MIDLRFVLPLATCLVLTACANPGKSTGRIDYQKEAATMPPLEVPPPLQIPAEGPEALALPQVTDAEATLLPLVRNVRMERTGDMRWLVVQSPPEELWGSVRTFLDQQGLEIAHEDVRIGLFETQWAENRADIPEGFIRGLISRVAPKLYAAHTRDRYRVRMERGVEPGTTEVFLTHYGVEQVEQGESLVWQPRPSDPELSAELMARLMLALGAPETQVDAAREAPAPAARARLEGDAVVVNEGFVRAWRRVGIALDRIGLIVEDLDRSQGVYWVKVSDQAEKKGWLLSLFSDKQVESETSFCVKVAGDDHRSRVTLESEAGKPLSEALRRNVLGQMEEQLR